MTEHIAKGTLNVTTTSSLDGQNPHQCFTSKRCSSPPSVLPSVVRSWPRSRSSSASPVRIRTPPPALVTPTSPPHVPASPAHTSHYMRRPWGGHGGGGHGGNVKGGVGGGHRLRKASRQPHGQLPKWPSGASDIGYSNTSDGSGSSNNFNNNTNDSHSAGDIGGLKVGVSPLLLTAIQASAWADDHSDDARSSSGSSNSTSPIPCLASNDTKGNVSTSESLATFGSDDAGPRGRAPSPIPSTPGHAAASPAAYETGIRRAVAHDSLSNDSRFRLVRAVRAAVKAAKAPLDAFAARQPRRSAANTTAPPTRWTRPSWTAATNAHAAVATRPQQPAFLEPNSSSTSVSSSVSRSGPQSNSIVSFHPHLPHRRSCASLPLFHSRASVHPPRSKRPLAAAAAAAASLGRVAALLALTMVVRYYTDPQGYAASQLLHRQHTGWGVDPLDAYDRPLGLLGGLQLVLLLCLLFKFHQGFAGTPTTSSSPPPPPPPPSGHRLARRYPSSSAFVAKRSDCV